MRKCFSLIILFLALMAILPASIAIERLNFGNGFVADNANVISKTDKVIINAFLWDLHKKTTADLAVVTVKSLKNQKAEDTALHIAKAFKLGAIGKDNGAVLVIAPREKIAAIYVGYDFDEIISDARKKQIIKEYLLPGFEDKNISRYIYRAVTILSADISDFYDVNISGLDYSIVPKRPISKAIKVSIFYYILSCLFFILAFVLCKFKKNNRFVLSTAFAFGGKLKSSRNW